MIYIDGERMVFLDWKEVFLAFYGDIKDEIGELKCAWGGRKVADSDVIIFDSLHQSGEQIPYIYNESHGVPGNYAEIRHICAVSVLHRGGGNQPTISRKSADEQLQEITEQYEKAGFDVSGIKRTRVPHIVDSYGMKHDPLIVVVSTLESQEEDDDE